MMNALYNFVLTNSILIPYWILLIALTLSYKMGIIRINWPCKLRFHNPKTTSAIRYNFSIWRQLSWGKGTWPLCRHFRSYPHSSEKMKQDILLSLPFRIRCVFGIFTLFFISFLFFFFFLIHSSLVELNNNNNYYYYYYFNRYLDPLSCCLQWRTGKSENICRQC